MPWKILHSVLTLRPSDTREQAETLVKLWRGRGYSGFEIVEEPEHKE